MPLNLDYIVESGGYDLRSWWAHYRLERGQHFNTAHAMRTAWFDHFERYLERRARVHIQR